MSNFPSIYATAQSKNMKIKDTYKIVNGSVIWLVNVSKNLNDWEVNEYEYLLQPLRLSRSTLVMTGFCGN